MLDDIQKEVEYQIKESDWMDDETKAFVLAKLVHMKRVIGYPDWFKNTTMVKHYFRGVSVPKNVSALLCNNFSIIFSVLFKLLVGKMYYENKLSYARYAKWKELRLIMADTE